MKKALLVFAASGLLSVFVGLEQGFAAVDATSVGSDLTPSTSEASKALTESCLLAPAKLSDAEVSTFLAQPEALLSDFPLGGLAMSNKVRALAGSSSSTLGPLTDLVARANTAQRAEIGAGLARAFNACSQGGHNGYAGLIQQAVVDLNDVDVLTAFAAAIVQTDVSAIDTGTVPGGADGGAFPSDDVGRINGAQNNFSVGGDETVPQGVQQYSFGSAGQYSSNAISPTTISQ